METDELQNDRSIDPENLDIEAIRQADLFYKWAKRSIAAKYAEEQAEFALEVTTARTAQAIRANPAAYGITASVTEPAIKAAIAVHPDYQKAVAIAQRCRYDAALLAKAVVAMEMKKSMLGELGRLYAQEYFAGPSVPHDLISNWQAHREKRTQRVNDKVKSRTPGERRA